MTEKMAMILINGFALATILLFQYLIPSISRRDILLGVKIPRDKMKTEEARGIIRGFRKENLLIGLVGIIISSFFLSKYNSVILISILPVLYLLILFLIYMRWNRKAKDLKHRMKWAEQARNVLAVDLKFSRDKSRNMGISRAWYLIPTLIILFNTVLSLAVYPSLPERIPTHWDIMGNVDAYMNKSLLVALMMPIVQLLMGLMIYGSNLIVMKSKQQIDGSDPEASLKRNIIFRRTWSINLLITLILMEIIFTVGNLMILGFIKDGRIQNIVSFGATGLILVIVFISSIKLGQGGEKIKLNDKDASNDSYDLDDDNLWKLANSIYYNPDDPSLFVEKRIGVGWTVNAGRPWGMFLLILPFIIIIVTLFLVK